MLSIIALVLVILGGINWFSIGLLQFDLVAGIFGTQSSVFSRIIYIIIGIAAVYLTYMSIAKKGLKINPYHKSEEKNNEHTENTTSASKTMTNMPNKSGTKNIMGKKTYEEVPFDANKSELGKNKEYESLNQKDDEF